MIYGERTLTCARDNVLLKSKNPLSGKVLAGYRVGPFIAEGAMAGVYEARRVEGGDEPLAIKVLFGEVALDDTLAARFAREETVATSLDHPNIARVVDAGRTDDGFMYIVMERVGGPSLRDHLDAAGALPPSDALRLARGLAQGLAHAHGEGFVHRDLKTENVVLGADGTPKIVDFGLAGVIQEHMNSVRLTKTGTTIGTPLYLAPEQFTSIEVDPRTDLYALGVMIYEMIAGCAPFEGHMAQVALSKVANDIPPPPAAAGLGAIALQLMRASPDERPESASVLVQSLAALD